MSSKNRNRNRNRPQAAGQRPQQPGYITEYVPRPSAEQATTAGVEPVEPAEAAPVPVPKPWKFRLLGGQDLFLMASIISKIGLDEFMGVFQSDALQGIVASMVSGEKINIDELGGMAAIAFGVESLNIVLSHLTECQNDINRMLADTSNLSLEAVKALGMVDYVDMICDFFAKEEFKDFTRVASRFIKRGK